MHRHDRRRVPDSTERDVADRARPAAGRDDRPWPLPPARRIVVGVHDSPAARDALSWAFGAAAREEADLEAVTAYQPVPTTGLDGSVVFLGGYGRELARATQEDVLRTELGVDESDPRIERTVVLGDPARVLVERSRHASLLVVGYAPRRLWRPRRASVVLVCTSQASCPVVVVRHQCVAVGRDVRREIARAGRAERP